MIKDFFYITNYVEGSKSAKMSIRKPIDEDRSKGINGDDFAEELEYLQNIGVEEVTIDINSIGGNIQQGFSIFQAIKDFKGKTITRVIGISASMAGMISQAGDERVILDYALFHCHGPQVPKGKKVDNSIVDLMRSSLVTILTSKSGISQEKAEELLSSENMFTAVEALNLGFFDRIEETKKKPVFMGVEVSNSEDKIKELYELANNFLNKKTIKMEKITSYLGLENASNEEAVLTAVTEIKNKATELEASLEVANTEKTALEAQVSELKNKMATSLVENAIKAGKIKKEASEKWVKLAVEDLGNAEELLGSLSGKTPAVEIANEFTPEELENRKNWDFQQWGENDPIGLEKMKNTDKAKFDALLENYLK